MWHTGDGWGWWMAFGWIWMIVFWGVIIWAVARAGRADRYGPHQQASQGGPAPTAREILDRRYAAGELTDEQFAAMRQLLSQPDAT